MSFDYRAGKRWINRILENSESSDRQVRRAASALAGAAPFQERTATGGLVFATEAKR
jgi:hypothetical protein